MFTCLGVLPRIKDVQVLLTAMVIGLALAESTGMLGLFLILFSGVETGVSCILTFESV